MIGRAIVPVEVNRDVKDPHTERRSPAMGVLSVRTAKPAYGKYAPLDAKPAGAATVPVARLNLSRALNPISSHLRFTFSHQKGIV